MDRRMGALLVALAWSCNGTASHEGPGVDASGESPGDAAASDAGAPVADAGPADGARGFDGAAVDLDGGPAPSDCTDPFRPMIAHDLGGVAVGEPFLTWRRSVVDDSRSLTDGRAVRVRTDPGTELLPACDGGHYFAGRTRLPEPVSQGRTVWLRTFQYIPSDFSFGYKYSTGAGDTDAARACGQHADGNAWLKWLVLAPDVGTARVYLLPTATRRALANPSPRIRLISEALHRAGDFAIDLPRDRWFALQVAVRVSDGDDGFIRAWIDDDFVGEVEGRTVQAGASLVSWGLGDYWNGVPWTDGAPGRTDFWIDEIIVASDADGYSAPTGVDGGGRPYIPSCIRAADLR